MPVKAAARHIEVTDKRLWRVVHHYVEKAVNQFDLSQLKAIGLDETASERGHNYVTIFIDMERASVIPPFLTSVKTRVFLGYSNCRGGTPPIAECGRILL